MNAVVHFEVMADDIHELLIQRKIFYFLKKLTQESMVKIYVVKK